MYPRFGGSGRLAKEGGDRGARPRFLPLGLFVLDEGFVARLREIDRRAGGAPARLRAYVGLFAGVLRNEDKMCLCGMLAADFSTLPRALRDSVRAFFDANEAWLAGVLEAGRRDRSLRLEGPPAAHARLLLSGLEGAMLVARSYGQVARFRETAGRFLAALGVPPRRRSASPV